MHCSHCRVQSHVHVVLLCSTSRVWLAIPLLTLILSHNMRRRKHDTRNKLLSLHLSSFSRNIVANMMHTFRDWKDLPILTAPENKPKLALSFDNARSYPRIPTIVPTYSIDQRKSSARVFEKKTINIPINICSWSFSH